MKILNYEGFVKHYLLVLLFISTALLPQKELKAQHWMSRYGYLNNYFQIKDSVESFFKSDTLRIVDKKFGFKDFQRWKTFLGPRVDINGSLSTYNKAYNLAGEEIQLREGDRVNAQW